MLGRLLWRTSAAEAWSARWLAEEDLRSAQRAHAYELENERNSTANERNATAINIQALNKCLAEVEAELIIAREEVARTRSDAAKNEKAAKDATAQIAAGKANAADMLSDLIAEREREEMVRKTIMGDELMAEEGVLQACADALDRRASEAEGGGGSREGSDSCKD